MILTDMNKTWVPPSEREGWVFLTMNVRGTFFELTYQQTLYWTGTLDVMARRTVTIYLNDQGREVLRTENRKDYLRPAPPIAAPKLSRWERFCLWFNREL